MTSLPPGVRARRRRDNVELPPMSRPEWIRVHRPGTVPAAAEDAARCATVGIPLGTGFATKPAPATAMYRGQAGDGGAELVVVDDNEVVPGRNTGGTRAPGVLVRVRIGQARLVRRCCSIIRNAWRTVSAGL